MQREAVAAKELMKATFARIRSEEETKRGLVIINAMYGRLAGAQAGSSAGEPANDLNGESEVIDVTVQLQVLVKDSRLFLHESSKVFQPTLFNSKRIKNSDSEIQILIFRVNCQDFMIHA